MTRKSHKVYKFVNHSKTVQIIAKKYGWFTGARYTNLRDVKTFMTLGFLDIDWKDYDFNWHKEVAMIHNPLVTVAKDIVRSNEVDRILKQAEELKKYCKYVVIVPKSKKIGPELKQIIPNDYILGYSVKTRYGGTEIPIEFFKERKVHLLGGRPERQRLIGDVLDVFSVDCNRFTLDARYGDYFDGEIFRPHPIGGYVNCIKDSIKNINKLWSYY